MVKFKVVLTAIKNRVKQQFFDEWINALCDHYKFCYETFFSFIILPSPPWKQLLVTYFWTSNVTFTAYLAWVWAILHSPFLGNQTVDLGFKYLSDCSVDGKHRWGAKI